MNESQASTFAKTVMLELSTFIVEERKKRGLTQVALANRSYIPITVLAKYENGEVIVSSSDFVKIIETLNIDPQITTGFLYDLYVLGATSEDKMIAY